MERIMRIALLSLMGAAAFKITYATLFLEDGARQEVMVRQELEAGAIGEPPGEEWRSR